MKVLAPGVSFLDLQFQRRPHIIATAVLHSASGVALIDPGPSSTLATLHGELASGGISLSDVTALVLTHIHLDHAGAAGTLVRENPRLRVYVHEKGAPHLADPTKLLASASRLYGDQMDCLWGEVAPVPAEVIVQLSGDEHIEVGGRRLSVAYTPGHASHHVSYWCSEIGIAFVGDTAGIKLRPTSALVPPTPPPDINLELWEASLARIEAWSPDTLFLTHFGPSSPAHPHLSGLREALKYFAELVRTSLMRDESDAARQEWFSSEVRQELARRSPGDGAAFEVAGPLNLSWQGLARYWRKRSA